MKSNYLSWLAASVCLGSFASVAASQAELTWSGGVMGTSVQYHLEGPFGEIFALAPSLNTGPLPLAIFDPADPRSLQIGLDLVSYVKYGALLPTGTVTFPVPVAPALVGLKAHAQFVTIDPAGTTPFLIDQVSNRATFVLGGHGDVIQPQSEVIVARQGHTATLLNDGSVLIAGGDEPGPGGALNVQATIETYNPQTQAFGFGGTMGQPRSTHTATRLADGRVLMLGGYQVAAGGIATATGEVYNPATKLFTPISAPAVGRTLHTATLLPNGNVLVVGGSTKFDLNDVFGSLGLTLKSTAVYNPNADTWTAGPNLPKPLFAHQATLLGSGKVLISSGVAIGDFFGIPIPGITTECHLYDPLTNTLSLTAPIPQARAYHGQITLPSGDAIALGGATGNFTTLTFSTETEVFLYNQTAGTWATVGNINVGRAYPNLVDTGFGIAVVGGLSTVDVTSGSGTPTQAIETGGYNGTGWVHVADQTLPRQVARAIAIDNGQRVLIVGIGDNGTTTNDKTAEVFVP
jgi:hypothetical protein